MTEKLEPEQRKRLNVSRKLTTRQRAGVIASVTGEDLFLWMVNAFDRESDPLEKWAKATVLLPYIRAKPKQKYVNDPDKADLTVPRLVIEPYSGDE